MSNGLLHNKSACQEYFMKNRPNTFLSIFGVSLMLWSFEEIQFGRKIWFLGGKIGIFWLQKKKYWVSPAHLGSVGGVQPNNYFSWPNTWENFQRKQRYTGSNDRPLPITSFALLHFVQWSHKSVFIDMITLMLCLY